MGRMKSGIAETEQKEAVALSLCLESGSLKSCPVHGEVIENEPDLTETNDIAKKFYKAKNPRVECFDSFKELKATIKKVHSESSFECGSCDR